MISCYDPEYNFQSFSIKRSCEKLCKPECDERYYPIEIVTSHLTLKSGFKKFILHSEFPGIIVKHIPEMSLIGLICNIGGLLGLWLGLSLFGIFTDIFHLYTKITDQKHINLISSRVNIVVNVAKIMFKFIFTNCIVRGSLKIIMRRIDYFFENVHFGQCKLQDYERKLKTITEKTFKAMFMVVSLCGLIYQVQIIYMSGKTVVSLEIGRLPDKSHPALTLCFNELFSMERAAEFQPGFAKMNKKYQDLLGNNSQESANEMQD